jgi:hypothetical protein
VSGRLLAIEAGGLVSYAGGWAEYLRGREAPAEETAPKPAKLRKGKPPRERPRGPSPLELIEREIGRTEQRIAELELQLAGDWTNVDLVSAHRAARDDLVALLERWEKLFEEAPAT